MYINEHDVEKETSNGKHGNNRDLKKIFSQSSFFIIIIEMVIFELNIYKMTIQFSEPNLHGQSHENVFVNGRHGNPECFVHFVYCWFQ